MTQINVAQNTETILESPLASTTSSFTLMTTRRHSIEEQDDRTCKEEYRQVQMLKSFVRAYQSSLRGFGH